MAFRCRLSLNNPVKYFLGPYPFRLYEAASLAPWRSLLLWRHYRNSTLSKMVFPQPIKTRIPNEKYAPSPLVFPNSNIFVQGTPISIEVSATLIGDPSNLYPLTARVSPFPLWIDVAGPTTNIYTKSVSTTALICCHTITVQCGMTPTHSADCICDNQHQQYRLRRGILPSVGG